MYMDIASIKNLQNDSKPNPMTLLHIINQFFTKKKQMEFAIDK